MADEMAEKPAVADVPAEVDDDTGLNPKRVKNKRRLRGDAAKRWAACPECGNEVANGTYVVTEASPVPGASPVRRNMVECAVCGTRTDVSSLGA